MLPLHLMMPSFRDEIEKIAEDGERSRLREYYTHAALNLGQAARDLRYLVDHPHADRIAPHGSPHHVAASITARVPSLASNLYYAALPPQLHHTPEELRETIHATAKEHFLHGYKPWKYKMPGDTERQEEAWAKLAPKTKTSAPTDLSKRVDAHHGADQKDWSAFEKNMRSPRFVAEVKRHVDSDDKLKVYAEQNSLYLRSKDTVAYIPSNSDAKLHRIKKLKSGRMGCSCRDWQYKCSWKGTDCKHVKAVKKGGIEKLSGAMGAFVSTLGRGANAGLLQQKSQRRAGQGRIAVQGVQAIRAGGVYG